MIIQNIYALEVNNELSSSRFYIYVHSLVLLLVYFHYSAWLVVDMNACALKNISLLTVT